MNRSANIFDDKTGLDRIIFFSDAVMAIAITLLVFDLNVPVIVLPRIISLILSFAVIGIYWESHHRIFRNIRRYDRGLIWLNLMYLFFVVLLPFTTRLIGADPLTRFVVILYAFNVVFLGAASLLILRHAYLGNRLIDAEIIPAEIRQRIRFATITPIIFLLSIAVSFICPIAAYGFWFLAFLVPIFLPRWMKIR
jgi:TMEM175 potassium channel family protein